MPACDQCGAPAHVTIILKFSQPELSLCRHHYLEHREELGKIAQLIIEDDDSIILGRD